MLHTNTPKRTTISVPSQLVTDFKKATNKPIGQAITMFMRREIVAQQRGEALEFFEKIASRGKGMSTKEIIKSYKDARKY